MLFWNFTKSFIDYPNTCTSYLYLVPDVTLDEVKGNSES